MNMTPPNAPNTYELRKFAAECDDQISDSAVFLSIFSGNFHNDPASVLQFGIAVLLDKPLYLLVPLDGTRVPDHVRAIASCIETYDPGDTASLQAATLALIEKAKEAGLLR